MRKPRVLTRCVANYHASTNERIVEFSHEGKGGLISFRAMADGTLRVEVYRTDEGVNVVAPKEPSVPVSALESLVEGSAATGRWLDARGHECSEDEEGATWEEYTEEEQNLWLQTVADTLQKEIAKAKGTATA